MDSHQKYPIAAFGHCCRFPWSLPYGILDATYQMVQHSFEANQIESNITRLTQDVEDDQTKLDELEASLPSKAEEMGMVPQKGALTIDLNGYQPSGDDVQ